jgi:hypothetical protein
MTTDCIDNKTTQRRNASYLRKMGICEVAIKKPTKSICGTNSSGANSVTSFTFATAQPKNREERNSLEE